VNNMPSNMFTTRRRRSSVAKSKRQRRYFIPSTHTSTLFLLFIFITQIILPPTNYCNSIIPKAHASGITNLVSSTYDRLFPEEDLILNDDYETKTLNIVEISNLRARDIKRRLARSHGYGVDELSRMLDKKELINTLSFEEHKAYQKEADRRKWIRFKNTVIYTCAAILIVMFWPLLRQAFEAASVNFVVYTGMLLCMYVVMLVLSYITSLHSYMIYFRQKKTRDTTM